MLQMRNLKQICQFFLILLLQCRDFIRNEVIPNDTHKDFY